MTNVAEDKWEVHRKVLLTTCCLVFTVLILGLIAAYLVGAKYLYALPLGVAVCFALTVLSGHFDRDNYNHVWAVLAASGWEIASRFYSVILVISGVIGFVLNADPRNVFTVLLAILGVLSGLVVMAAFTYFVVWFEQRLESLRMYRAATKEQKMKVMTARLLADNKEMEASLRGLRQQLSVLAAGDGNGRGYSRYHALSGQLKAVLDKGALPFHDVAAAQEFRVLVEDFFREHDKKMFEKLARSVRGSVHPDRLKQDDVAPVLNAMIDDIKRDERFLT